MRWTRLLRPMLTLGRRPRPSAAPGLDDTSSTTVSSEVVNCLGCETTNPKGARFCLKCGTTLIKGALARLMGDAILAFFGAPIAHEDDPQRAVLTGLDIIQGIAPYREQVKRRWDLDFQVRVGINTGLVVVGEVGSDLRVEYTALGDAINMASRMEQTARLGTVQVTADTYN